MKNKMFEIAVVGYDYRFKTSATDSQQAKVKIMRFLRVPGAKCSVLAEKPSSHVRETESCRTQVQEQ